MYKLSKYEMETVINFNDAEKIAYVSSSQKRVKEQIRKYAKEYPDEVKIISEDAYTIIAHIPKYYVRMKPKRYMSEEQKQANAKRLAEYRAKILQKKELTEAEKADFETLEEEEKVIYLDED